MSEQRAVFVNDGPDATGAMRSNRFGKGGTDMTAIVRDVIRNDFGELTIDSINVIG